MDIGKIDTISTASKKKSIANISFHPHWWNCNTNVENSPLICINYDLTCDGLPHCAELQIPNPDEDCDYHVSTHFICVRVHLH